MSDFKKELETLINKCSVENGSDTPDFILASYLSRCLYAFNNAVNMRERWYGRDKEEVAESAINPPKVVEKEESK